MINPSITMHDAKRRRVTLTMDVNYQANSKKSSMSILNNIWFVDSGVLNYITSHNEWFYELQMPEQPIPCGSMRGGSLSKISSRNKEETSKLSYMRIIE